MFKLRENEGEKGITLIALVITIIVLLILAGISIAMVTGENGILKQAAKAKEETENAAKNEKTDLAKMEDLIKETLNGVEVEQVTDTAPGVLEENDTEYTINSIEDLVFFAYDVTNGNNYEGKTVKLGTSLDFNSTKSYVDPFRTDYGEYGYAGELKTLLTSGEGFKSIGIATEDDRTKIFGGTFEGNNNFINNLYINVTSDTDIHVKRGLFANNFGTINNLKLTNVNLYLNYKSGAIAGISGQNSTGGIINNCIVTGNIKNESSIGSSGGITAYCSGRISNCGNLANVYLHTTVVGSGSNCGGIFTSAGASSEIINCYNKGTIIGIADAEDLFVGGIAGTTGGIIKNCYNIGSVSGEGTKALRIGGIVGNIYDNSVDSCYSIRTVRGNQTSDAAIGMIIGRKSGGTTRNIYYKKIDETQGIGVNGSTEDELIMQKTEEQMKQDSFVDLLNSENDGVVWKKDEANINNGYPILNYQ